MVATMAAITVASTLGSLVAKLAPPMPGEHASANRPTCTIEFPNAAPARSRPPEPGSGRQA